MSPKKLHHKVSRTKEFSTFKTKERCVERTSKRKCMTGIFSFTIVLLIALIDCAASDSPTIVKGPIVYKVGDTIQITCHGNKPLSWNSEIDIHTNPRVNITESHDVGNEIPYTSNLTIVDATLQDSVFFSCEYPNENSSSDEDRRDSVVIYVTDNLLPNITTGFHVNHGDDFFVPCATPWSDAKISITLELSQVAIDLNSTHYNRRRGILLHSSNITSEGQMSGDEFILCYAELGEKTQEVHIHVSVSAPQPNQVRKPKIFARDGGSIGVGEDFWVRCESIQSKDLIYDLKIVGSQSIEDELRKKSPRVMRTGSSLREETLTTKRFVQELRINNASKEDTGNFTCNITPSSTADVKSATIAVNVYEIHESFLNIATASEHITVKENENAKWAINISSFPSHFNFTWLNQAGRAVQVREDGNGKYQMINQIEGEYLLKIQTVSIDDIGNHPFIVRLPETRLEKRLNLYLNVRAAPSVTIDPTGPIVNCKAGTLCRLNCTVKASPPATITWKHKKCESCGSFETISPLHTEEMRHGNWSIMEFIGKSPDVYLCNGKNSLKSNSVEARIRIVDPDFVGRNAISIMTTPDEVVEGDDVTITCALSKFDAENQGKRITFVKLNGNQEARVEESRLKRTETEWSRRVTFTLEKITKQEIGSYMCTTGGTDPVKTTKYLNVLDAKAPIFSAIVNSSLSNSTETLKIGESKDLVCKVEGFPRPVVTWKWDGLDPAQWPEDVKYEISTDGSTLSLRYVPKEGIGRYECLASNRLGSTSSFVYIDVTGDKILNNYSIAFIMVLLILLLIFGAMLGRYKYKREQMRRWLREIQREDFMKGAPDAINPDLSVTDQAYLLPFDSRWEFPQDRLKLGMQLGSGAFGRVVKADAVGILENEPQTTVAVKMVKPNADQTHFKALMSELKIMVHLGKHINVVNLLGACTKNLSKKKELLVIVEYCKYGSLLSYLHRNKRTFINQLDSRGNIDPNIERRDSLTMTRPQFSLTDERSPMLNYASLTFTDDGTSRAPASNGYVAFARGTVVEGQSGPQTDPNGYLTPTRQSTDNYVAESQVESVCTGVSYLSNGQSTLTTDGARSSVGGQWQDHYRGDYKALDVEPIKTTDLLCWAFQIARGMEYLASRKVLHGDLAARNVLLAENNVVKICDFGLAKEMYKDYKYKKKSEGVLLPVKWMAIESIFFGVFSSHSDCWSFGVVLWELFTLGKTPYPGMDANERFYEKIAEGYRMEKPAHAPSCVYDIMMECWAKEPSERPTFSTLVDKIGDMMEEGLRNHYVDLNADYMRINKAYMLTNPDYLSQMSRMEFSSNSARPTPDRQYQNVTEDCDDSGYLRPIVPQLPSSLQPSQHHQYQNVSHSGHEPTMVAVNNGYQFIPATNSSPNEVSLQMSIRPSKMSDLDVKVGSSSPERNSSDNNEDVDTHFGVQVRSNGSSGIDNRNYIPNHTFINDHRASSKSEPSKVVNRESSNSQVNRRPRQKNDSGVSGVGSIDSTHFDQQKYSSGEQTPSPDQYVRCSHLTDSNGYVSHQHIPSLG